MKRESMSFYIAAYRHHVPFPVDVVMRAMTIVARWLPDFLPAELPVTRKRAIQLASPADFDPSLVPAAFVIEPDVDVRIPLYGCERNVQLVVNDNRKPWTLIPANVSVIFTATLPPLDRLEGLLCDLIEEFQPEAARLTDDDTPFDPDVEMRRFDVETSVVPDLFSWLTWLNPGIVEIAGPEALARLSALCHVRRVAGGAIVRLQDEPTAPGEAWSRRRQAAEDAFGLAELHRRFPRNMDARPPD